MGVTISIKLTSQGCCEIKWSHGQKGSATLPYGHHWLISGYPIYGRLWLLQPSVWWTTEERGTSFSVLCSLVPQLLLGSSPWHSELNLQKQHRGPCPWSMATLEGSVCQASQGRVGCRTEVVGGGGASCWHLFPRVHFVLTPFLDACRILMSWSKSPHCISHLVFYIKFLQAKRYKARLTKPKRELRKSRRRAIDLSHMMWMLNYCLPLNDGVKPWYDPTQNHT